MDINDIANGFTALCVKGEFTEAGHTYWSDDVVSCEPMPGDMAEIKGRAAVDAKAAWWYANNEVHGVKVEGPYVHGHQFMVRFTMDLPPKDGTRVTMDEMALYTVMDGKIVEERFFYGSAA